MSKKQSKWPETLVKTSTPSPKKGGKDPAALIVPVSSGGKQSGSATFKPIATCGRSNSLNSRSADLNSGGIKVGGSLKRSSQSSKPASHPARPALRLCSSRSFSSLHTSSLAAVPFMRSSRSLNRLDQRSARDGTDPRKGQTTEKKVLDSGQQSSSVEEIRMDPDQCHGDNAKKMKTRGPTESSSLVPTTASDCDKVKKETRDGVYTLCAMTSGMRRNWVQAVLKNVRHSHTLDTTSSFLEEKPQQISEQQDSDSVEVECRAQNPNSSVQESSTREWAEDSHQQLKGQERKLHLEREQSSADGSSPSSLSPVSPSASSAVPPINPPQQMEEGECASCPLDVAATQTGPSVEGAGGNSPLSKRLQDENTPQSEKQHVSLNSNTCDSTQDEETLHQTGQLVRELEQTQKELSRLQQLNRNLQDELQQEREKIDLLNSSPSSAFQRLHKMNHDLRLELEAEKRSQEEAREAELRRRVDLLAQQAQLLVTGDATALAQAHLEQDRRRFHEQRVEWETSVATLQSQLGASEQQRREAELRLTELQQEVQGFHSLQQEAERLQQHLQEVTTHLCANEKAQAQKDARLQKHLMLLQASQDRERRSLSASLAQAEDHSQDLQKKLDRAEQQVESLSKSQTWAREIEEAQQQLQEELERTISAVEKLQEERKTLDRRCQELQNQLTEADGEVSRVQSRLKVEETHYYNLEHSYERACEDLQLALGKVQQRESEMQDIREAYDQLLDRKEQELTEVLLKMEVLGNSLEETEVKLNEMQNVCTCASSQTKDELSELKQGQQTTEPHTVDNRSVVMESVQVSGSHEPARTRSRSIDLSFQSIITAGDDPEGFVSVIQLLETKLFMTEEKLRDITQRLEEHQSHITCQDPHLCSQLTQSRATTQHLSLLLHSQAKQSQRFALETENCCRLLAGRFQVALNIIQTCRERLQSTQLTTTDLEKQLATVAACLQQGGKDAEDLQHESYNAGRGENKILKDETLNGATSSSSTKSTGESVGTHLIRELFVVEKMVSVLQGQHGIGQLSGLSREDEGDVSHRYKSIILQRLALKTERRTQSGGEETLESAMARVCAEAELIYIAMKLTERNNQREGLADISPPELAPYEEQVQEDGQGLEEAAKSVVNNQLEAEKEPEWLDMLISSLQRRAKLLHQLCQEIPDDDSSTARGGESDSTVDLNRMQEHAKLIYLSERLRLDLEQELQQSEALRNKLQDMEKEQDGTLTDELEVLNCTLRQLQRDNSELREELGRAEQKIESVESGNQRLIEDTQEIEGYHKELTQKLEGEFQEKIKKLQQIHEEEMKHLHSYYTKSCVTKEKQTKSCTEEDDIFAAEESVMKRATKGEPGNETVEGDALAARESFQKDMENLQASCGQISAMEEMHKKMIDDLQQQHRTEVAALLKEKDQLLQEETAATMAAIVAMRRAHKQELEKYRQSQQFRESADITQLHIEYEKEIQLLHKELESLSIQHTQKCVENSQLSQELQDEKELLMQYQQENQELKQKQSDTDETSHLCCSLNGDQSHLDTHLNDFYEMEVILRAREAEMQFLRQEARSLKEELKIARMDKIYAQNKLKALYKNHQEESPRDVNKSSEDLKFATWSPSREASGPHLKDTATNTSNGAFPKKKEKSSLICKIRGVRSKSLKEGLSIQERMKLFESC